MQLKRILPLIVCFWIFSGFYSGPHKFYVSVTEVEYNQNQSSLQIISRVFTDDMEKLLQTRYLKDLYLARESEHDQADVYLEEYLSQKLKITVDGTSYPHTFLGKQYDNDLLILYIEVEDVKAVSQIYVKNQILTDLFPGQKNVVHVEVGDKTRSLLLNRDRDSGLLNFGN